MNKQQRFLLIIGGLLAVGAVALWPLRAAANVTLISFTATPVSGQPKIDVAWATATQYDTVGFFIVRSDTADGDYTRVSDWIERMGDDLTGWEYGPWTDTDVVLGRTYWYKLEELTTRQESLFYGPVTATIGAAPTIIPPTATFTPTSTRTPTAKPSPIASATTAPDSKAQTSTSTGAVATPRGVAGATITPLPKSPAQSTSAAAPLPAATTVAQVFEAQSPPQPAPTAVPSLPDAAAAPGAAQSDRAVLAGQTAQVPDPTLVPPDAVSAVEAPAVVVTEAAPSGLASSDFNNTAVLLLVGAACLFLGIAFFILRQARQ